MPRRYPVFQVDAFTRRQFTGNPAGVVLDADTLSEEEMLAIARELNNADTAFVLSPDGADHDMRVRFFTPRIEAAFVGHATVAANYVLSRSQGAAKRRQKQKAGIYDIEIRGEGDARRIAIRLPAPPLGRELSERERLAVIDALALSTGDLDHHLPMRIGGSSSTRLLIGVRGAEQLRHLKPDPSRLVTLSAQLGAAGYFVFTLQRDDQDALTESRMFCPALGIPEDPVSGNAHGILAAYLDSLGLLPKKDGRAAFRGVQGHYLNRPGIVDVELGFGADDVLNEVWILGDATLVFETEISLPD